MNNNKKIPDPEELDNPEEDAKTKSLCTAVIPPIKTSIVEKTSTTFLDAYQINIDHTSTDNMNNNNETKANETPSKKSTKDQKAQPQVSDSPIVSYETSGEGRKLPIVIFNCNALSQPQPMLAGQNTIWPSRQSMLMLNSSAKYVTPMVSTRFILPTPITI